MDAIKRDVLFFLVLIVLIKVAVDHHKNSVTVSNKETLEAIVSTVKSPMAASSDTPEQEALVHNDENTSESSALQVTDTDTQLSKAPLEVHEIDQTVVQHIERAEAHIQHLIPLVASTSKLYAQLQSMLQRLAQLKKEYMHTSPAIALLGPLGTTGIVLKENEVEKNVLRMVNMTRTIAQQLLRDEEKKEPYQSIAQGLEQNDTYLASLVAIDQEKES